MVIWRDLLHLPDIEIRCLAACSGLLGHQPRAGHSSITVSIRKLPHIGHRWIVDFPQLGRG